ncbi:MAG TPA: D-alanine--poly(phosphoribitol) ligase subunit DltA [Patescibacteria group bacterium]
MIIEKIDKWGMEIPNKIAHISGEKKLTYGELSKQSDILAAFIGEQLKDEEKKSPIAVRGHKKSEMLVGFLGAVKAGHPYVPIDSSIPEERAEKIIQSSKAGLVLNEEKIADIVAAGAGRALAEPIEMMPDDPFYILFTSGSTGEPKGVVITKRNLESFVSWMLEEQEFSEQKEVFLNQAPFSFDLSVMDVYPSLVTGGTLVSVTKDDIANPSKLHVALQNANPTVWVSTPSFAQLCLMEKTFGDSVLPNLRKFLFCGETLSPKTASDLLDRFSQCEIWNTYGPTEATVATSSIRITREIIDKFPSLPVGYPKSGCELRIYGENDRMLAAGESGEIIIVGDNVSPGYLGRPDLTERVFFMVEKMPAYRTGDQGYLKDGCLFFEGRMDNQIKLHGYRIELDDIAANLEVLSGIQRAVVMLKNVDGTNDFLVAFVGDENPEKQTEFERTKMLKKELSKKLPAYMIPKKIVFVPGSFPMTANGKVDRKILMASIN